MSLRIYEDLEQGSDEWLQARAEAQAAACQRMLDLNGGVGLLGVREPEAFKAMEAWSDSTENDHADTVLTMAAALTAVLDLHAVTTQTPFGLPECSECRTLYPCPTVRVITEKLGGDRG